MGSFSTKFKTSTKLKSNSQEVTHANYLAGHPLL
jgi:hypothetical protein